MNSVTKKIVSGKNITEIHSKVGNSNAILLVSYKTPVAYIENGAIYKTDTFYSKTTSKQINQFAARFGASCQLNSVSQKEIDDFFRLHGFSSFA